VKTSKTRQNPARPNEIYNPTRPEELSEIKHYPKKLSKPNQIVLLVNTKNQEPLGRISTTNDDEQV